MVDDLIAALDDALADYGDDVILRRTGAPDLPAKAHVVSYRLRDTEFVTNTAIAQEELILIMSPTEITNAGWPGGTPSATDMLIRKGDKLIVRGKIRNIEVADPHRINGDVVRYDMRAVG